MAVAIRRTRSRRGVSVHDEPTCDRVVTADAEALRGPRSDGILPAGQPPRQVGVQALDAPPGPSHPARGARSGPRRRHRARRARRHSDGGRRRARRRPPRPLPGRTPPDASSLPTAEHRPASTSQYRVGMGVPSPRNGALRITAGSPRASRTTTSNSACGGLPSAAATAPRSVASVGAGVNARTRASALCDPGCCRPTSPTSPTSPSSPPTPSGRHPAAWSPNPARTHCCRWS